MTTKTHASPLFNALGIHPLDAIDRRMLANIKNVVVQEVLIGYDTTRVHHVEDLKHLLFAVAFALVAKPFGNDFARLPQARVAKLRKALLYAMALDVTSIEHPETATMEDIRDALYTQTRQVAEYVTKR